MTIDEQIEILQARKAGKEIQWRARTDPRESQQWHDNAEDIWCNFAAFDYRVKPEKQTRTLWVNCYETSVHSHCSREEAQMHSTHRRLSLKKVTFAFTPGEVDNE